MPATVGLDSERFLAFIPAAPTAAAVWMDAAVGAASFAAESWLEAAGAVGAENQVLRFLADLAGLPNGAGGCFMSGGSIGNLSALAVARDHARDRARRVAVADTAHASVDNALHLLGLDALVVPTAADGRFTADALRAAAGDGTDIATIVASAGSTNAGVVDDLAGLADLADEWGSWLHVDGAYGAAALLVGRMRSAFTGIERADSLIVDPHKWLFATSGSCALLYRDTGAGGSGAHAAWSVPRRAARRRCVEPERLRLPAHPQGERTAAVVLARGARRRRPRCCGRARHRSRPPRRRRPGGLSDASSS